MEASAIAHSNIALIKYWGKKNEELIIPTNSSLSITMDAIYTKATVKFDKHLTKDELYINGKKEEGKSLERLSKFLDIVREMSGEKIFASVKTETNFPLGSGLASSASSYAAIAAASAKAIGLNLDNRELSILARRGSGSACRSIFGGFVLWQKGTRDDGKDSFAVQLFDEKYWPEIRNVIGISSTKEKRISSRSGMAATVKSSTLFEARLKYVEERLNSAIEAIKKKDFHVLAEIIMKESNNMHAVMLDTWPPIIYLDDKAKEIIYSVIEYNESLGENVMAYTFDAGANPHIYTTEEYVEEAKKILNKCGIIQTIVCKPGPGIRYVEK